LGEALARAAEHDPALREPVLQVYREVLETMRDGHAGDCVLDTTFATGLVWNLIDLRATEFADLILELYARELVETLMVGSGENVLAEMELPAGKPVPLQSMAKFYRELNPSVPSRDTPNFLNLADSLPVTSTAPKRNQAPENDFEPGRNDPCPCGSGKKYKKCCLN
jgi:hypothetical protein